MPNKGYKQTEEHKNRLRLAQVKYHPHILELTSKEYKKIKNREKYEKYREYFKYKAKRWRLENKERQLKTNRDYRRKLKKETLLHYGELICVYCKEDNIDLLSLDHVNGDGKEHRKLIGIKSGGNNFYLYLRRNKFPQFPLLQILCISCNSKKQ